MQNYFPQVAERYGLSHPQQIKERIMWDNLKAIITHLYGSHPENQRLVERYEADWKACETELTQQKRT